MNKKELCVLSNTLVSQIEEKLKNWQSMLEGTENLNAKINENNCSEIIDQANKETMLNMELEKSSHQTKTLNEIRIALKKIKHGTYGICEESGETIETNRLIANPLARYTLEAQEDLEMEMRNMKKM